MWATTRRMGLSELNTNELKRRIEAARLLRNISQTQLDDLFSADGLGKSAGRLERGALTLNRALLDGLVRHLRVPEQWFTSPDIDPLLLGSDVGRDAELAAIRASLDELLRYRQDAQEQLGTFDVEDARDFLNLLQEVRTRQGREVGRHELRSRAATGR